MNLLQTINWASTFIQYAPLTNGLGLEPAVSVATMIRNSILNPPLTWLFNRNQTTFVTTAGQQDYPVTLADFGFLETVSLTDNSNPPKITQIKDVYNNQALAVSSVQQKPGAVSVQSVNSSGQIVFRFMGVPDQAYTVSIVYQKRAADFGPFVISSVANVVAGNTSYTGVFDPYSFPTGASATITGFSNAVNNGTFVIVSCSTTVLVVANGSGVTETKTGFVSNLDWSPLPDWFRDVYNNLFLAEAMSMVDDARSQIYRQRGVAAFLAKADGLTEMQKNIFAQQWLQDIAGASFYQAKAAQGTQVRAV